MGNTMYVITGISEASEIDKNFTRSSFEVFERRFMTSCGASEELLEKFYASLDPRETANAKTRSLDRMTHAIHTMQLLPGGYLSEFIAVSKNYYEAKLLSNAIGSRHYVSLRQDRKIHLPLLPFVFDFFVDAGQRSLFGEGLSEMDPSNIWNFLELDKRSWQLLLNVPAIFAPEVYAARDRMMSSIQRYLDTPCEERPNRSRWMQSMEAQMKAKGFTTKQMATVIVPMYIGFVGSSHVETEKFVQLTIPRANTSTYKACFWMISFMLFHPELLDLIRQETKPAIQPNGVIDLEYLKNECPHLSSIWHETLRLATSAGSFRLLTTPTQIGNKLLRKDCALVIPSRQLHFNKSVFGPSTHEFQPDRFFQTVSGEKSSASFLHRSRSWRPFGGGFNHCPGRFVAYQQTSIFITLLLHRFDIELASPQQRFPRWAEGDPFPGMMAPRDKDDLRVALTERGGDIT